LGTAAKIAIFTLSALALMAARASRPDLVADDVKATPAAAQAGAEIEIRSTVRNAGKRTKSAIDVDVGVFVRATDATAIAPLTAWTKSTGLGSGKKAEDATRVYTPAGLTAGDYFICADADPDKRITEENEDNNRSCVNFTVLPKPGDTAGGADLVIESITPGAAAQASLTVKIRIRNAGVSPVDRPFKVKAFRRNPRAPLYLTSCPLTEGQLAAGSPSGCPDLTYDKTLAPGASDEIVGYFNYYVAGASLVTQPIKPGQPKPPGDAPVDFMVDGCFPPADHSEVWCAINEIDEINNFKMKRLPAR
jgi:hypothetical protein